MIAGIPYLKDRSSAVSTAITNIQFTRLKSQSIQMFQPPQNHSFSFMSDLEADNKKLKVMASCIKNAAEIPVSSQFLNALRTYCGVIVSHFNILFLSFEVQIHRLSNTTLGRSAQYLALSADVVSEIIIDCSTQSKNTQLRRSLAVQISSDSQCCNQRKTNNRSSL